MSCKHENADRLKPGERFTDRESFSVVAQCEQLRCLDCGEWLSLGPAAATPADELNLAALLNSVCRLWEPGAAQDEAVDLAAEDCARQSVRGVVTP